MFGGGGFGLVKHLDAHGVAVVDERRKTDQRLATFADFHQLGQLAKGPLGVALLGGGGLGGWRGFDPLSLRERVGVRAGLRRGWQGGWRSDVFELERGQGLKGAARLAAQLGLEGAEVAALTELAAVFVHHPQVHEQMGRQHVDLDVVAHHRQLGGVAHAFQDRVGQAAVAKHLGRGQLLGHALGGLWQRHQP